MHADNPERMRPPPAMSRWRQFGLVLAGYVLAAGASVVVVAIYDRRLSPADNQAMGGMIAGGEMMLGGGVFALASLVPTGLALWFLRGSQRFWSGFTVIGLGFAIAGLAAVLTTLVARGGMTEAPAVALLGFLGIVQMLGAPIWIGGFLVFAALAPAGKLRKRMLVATTIEVVVAGFALVHFLGPSLPF
jgi:hypothetical protein